MMYWRLLNRSTNHKVSHLKVHYISIYTHRTHVKQADTEIKHTSVSGIKQIKTIFCMLTY